MPARAFGATLLPDGRLLVFSCGAGIEHRVARNAETGLPTRTTACQRDVGPHTIARGVRLVLADGSLHHATIEPSEAVWYADRVDDQSAKRARLDENAARPRVKRDERGRPVTAPEPDAAFYARAEREACGLAEERDKARGRVARISEAPRVAVEVSLKVDQKGVVVR